MPLQPQASMRCDSPYAMPLQPQLPPISPPLAPALAPMWPHMLLERLTTSPHSTRVCRGTTCT